MENSIVYIHTTSTIVDYITKLSKKAMPNRKIFHVVDETILFDIKKGDSASALKKLKHILEGAQHSGAQQFMVTCTSTGRLIDSLDEALQARIVRIEEPAIAEMKSRQGITGITYTNPTVWLEMELILERLGVSKDNFAPCFVEGAFENILSGNTDSHDKLIDEYIRKHRREYASFLLAQVSVCSAIDRLETLRNDKRIISMAEFGIQRVKENYDA